MVSAVYNGVGLVGGQSAERAVGFGKDQHASQRVVQSPFAALLVDLLQRHGAGVYHRLADQAALDLLVGRERRLGAQQHLQELQALHMCAKHKKTNGERRRQQQPDRPP